MSKTKLKHAHDQPIVVAWHGRQDTQSLRVIQVQVTAYCPCAICCGKNDGITSSGKLARANHTVAVDPDLIPLGTRLYLEGIGTYLAEDTGGVIKGHKIDLFMNDHQQALNFGVRTTNAYILQDEI